jgi:hypothetical protein
MSDDDREGICGDVSPTNCDGMPMTVCVLRFGHGSEWHEGESGMRWKYLAEEVPGADP